MDCVLHRVAIPSTRRLFSPSCLYARLARHNSALSSNPATDSTASATTPSIVQARTPSSSWTEEEESAVLRLRAQGLTFREISAKLPGRTRSGIVNHFYITMRNRADRLRRRRVKVDGETSAETASPATKTTIPELEMPEIKPLSHWTADELKQLMSEKRSGASWDAIARRIPSRSKTALQLAYYAQRRQGEEPLSSRRPWGASSDAELLRARNQLRLSWKEVAERLSDGDARSTAAAKLRYSDVDPLSPLIYLSARNLQDRDISRANKLRAEGLSWKAIAARMGGKWTPSSLYDRCRAAERFPDGVPKRKLWTAEEDQRLLMVVQQHGGVMDEVEKVLGRTLRSCQARLRALRARESNGRSGSSEMSRMSGDGNG